MGKIVDVKFILKEYRYDKPFHIVGSISSGTTNIEIELILDSGARGYGEASPSFRVNGEKVEVLFEMQNFVRETIMGMDVRNYRKILILQIKCLQPRV